MSNARSISTASARALQTIVAGRRYESPSLRAHLTALQAAGLRLETILSPLERLVLSAIGDGSDDNEAAKRLDMGYHAVRKHREHLHQKLGITSRPKLITFAHEHGFVRFENGRVSRPIFDSLLAEWQKHTRRGRKTSKPDGPKPSPDTTKNNRRP